MKAGDEALFTDKDDSSRGTVPCVIEEVLVVPSGELYVVRLESGGKVQPVFPEELAPKYRLEPGA